MFIAYLNKQIPLVQSRERPHTTEGTMASLCKSIIKSGYKAVVYSAPKLLHESPINVQQRWSIERSGKPKLSEWLVLNRELNIECDATSIFVSF